MSSQFWPFKKARAFARKHQFRTSIEWKIYSKSGKLPPYIPRTPEVVYKNKGWNGFRDWLTDTRHLVKGRYKKFDAARKYTRRLNLEKVSDWPGYASSDEKPDDIPSCPEVVYADLGWIDYYDWLGLMNKSRGPYLPYEEAKKFVQKLNLKTKKEWIAYIKENRLPNNIPKNPYSVYRDKGYKGMGDWLNSGYVDTKTRTYRTFNEARDWARKQNLKTVDDWFDLARSGGLPNDIPRTPNIVYKNKWVSFPDWLGNKGSAVPRYRKNRDITVNRDFKLARDFARGLGLKTKQDWINYTQSGECPPDIPSDPSKAYSEWVSYADWLGVSGKYRRFSSA